MLDYKLTLSGLALGLSIAISVANAALQDSEPNSGYDATGIALQPTGKFAELLRRDQLIHPQEVSNPSLPFLIQSTLSRQVYISKPDCIRINWPNQFPIIKWDNPYPNNFVEVFKQKIIPQNLDIPASGRNLVEINFNTQPMIYPVPYGTNASADGVLLYCMAYQSGGSVPCSLTGIGPNLLQQKVQVGSSDYANKAMTSYSGYVEIDNHDEVEVVIGLSTIYGSRSQACYHTLILRTR